MVPDSKHNRWESLSHLSCRIWLPRTQGLRIEVRAQRRRPRVFQVARFDRSSDRIITASLTHHVNKPMPGRRSKKSSKPPTNLSWGIMTNIAVGPLGFQAEVDIDPKEIGRAHV